MRTKLIFYSNGTNQLMTSDFTSVFILLIVFFFDFLNNILVFAYLPELNHFLEDFDNLHQAWSTQKRVTPSYGAILLSPDYKHVSCQKLTADF